MRYTAAIALLLCTLSVNAEEGIRPMREGLRPRDAEKLDKKLDARMKWIHELGLYLRRNYKLPKKRPEIFLVTRDYILRNEKTICFHVTSPEELRACSSRVFGWIDDDRRILFSTGRMYFRRKDSPGRVCPTFRWNYGSR